MQSKFLHRFLENSLVEVILSYGHDTTEELHEKFCTKLLI